MNVLKVDKISKKFGNTKVLNEVSFSINQGEIFGFIGPNGAGKSTTIKMIMGLTKANQGDISIFGLDAWRDRLEAHKEVAYVPGDINLWPNLSGGEIIHLLLKLRNQKPNEKTEKLIKEFNLDTSKKARTYSKGNKQKVILIAALSSDARLYIFDEPTSGLDPLMERVFQNNIKQLKEEGKTVLLSSHILSEVEQVCDSIGIIKDGRIIESGTLKEMKHLKRTIVEVTTKHKVSDLAHFKGVSDINQEELELSFSVENENLNSILEYLSNYEIVSLVSKIPTLEDLFMRYYESDK